MLNFFQRNKTLKNPTTESFGEGDLAKSVFTTTFVMTGNSPVVKVIHDRDDDWQFLSAEGADMSQVMLVSLLEIVDRDKTINELSSLPMGQQAARKQVGDKWVVSKKD